MDVTDVTLPGHPFTENILLEMSKYLSGKELMELRRVCKPWNDVITSSKHVQNKVYSLKVKRQSLSTFKSLSFPVKAFQFMELNVENELFRHQHIFRNFTMKFCPQITSIEFYKCSLPTGRFFELLAFCKQIKTLQIKRCPSIYHPDISIIHWQFCFKYVKKNLELLQTLIIVEKVLSETNLCGFTCDMKQLKQFRITIDDGCLPVRAIGKIIQNNSRTLQVLTVKGTVHRYSSEETGLLPKDTQQMQKLKTLSLYDCQFKGKHIRMLEDFLDKCSALEKLHISNSTINKNTLLRVTNKLTQLLLHTCSFGEGTFKNRDFSRLTSLKLYFLDEMNEDTKLAVKRLLTRTKPELKELELQLVAEAGHFVKILTHQNHPKLTQLTLSECVDVVGKGLRSLFENLNQLTYLSITESSEVQDFEMCPSSSGGEKYSLKNLTKLKVLNLTGTKVGDQTITDCLIFMDSLERINLNETRVTGEGLRSILDASKENLTKLKAVFVVSCKNLKQEDYDSIASMDTKVNVYY